MEEDYDVIVLGTGFKESILSGLCAMTKQLKVLHIDRNNYYGSESASLDMIKMFEKFRNGDKPAESLGRSRDYCIDLCPKFVMAGGNLVRILVKAKCTKHYLQFKLIQGSYVYRDGKIHKVPATAAEALSSSLMGIFEKRRFRDFLEFMTNYNVNDAKTQQGHDLSKESSEKLFKDYKLDPNVQQFVGHAIALYENDDYLQRPATELSERIKLYANSMARHGSSPYIYPIYGLGGLPEAFSRICAVNGGTFMLNKGIKQILYNEDGTVMGIEDDEGKIAKCKKLICDPSYVVGTNKIKKLNKIIRCICILSGPVPGTNNAESSQIIIPFHQIKGRKNDIYIGMVSHHHSIAPAGKYVAVVNTIMESANDQDAEREIAPALALLGKIDEKFLWTTDYYEPTNDGSKDNVYVCSNLDSSTHFEVATEEVMNVYKVMFGHEIDLNMTEQELKEATEDD